MAKSKNNSAIFSQVCSFRNNLRLDGLGSESYAVTIKKALIIKALELFL